MPVTRVNDNQLLEQLTEVFRLHGYEGASLSLIAEATGLQRASLYHRFPGGKEEMALAVLRRIDEQFSGHVLAPLGEPGDPAARLRTVARRLDRFYQSGRQSCVLDTLSLGDPDSPMRRHIEGSMTAWIGAFAAIARESGHAPAAARRRAEEAVLRIQGALVLSRTTGDRSALRRALKSLPRILADAGPH